jgi:hypothetical protein
MGRTAGGDVLAYGGLAGAGQGYHISTGQSYRI